MAEITDQELAELRSAHGLLKSLYADSNVGFDFRKLVKKKFPAASIPELEAVNKTEELGSALEKKISEGMTSLEKKIDGFFEGRAKEKEESDVALFGERVNKISKERGLTEEGTQRMLTIMKERGIQHPEDAVVILEAGQPKRPKQPKSYNSRWNPIQQDGKDDEGYLKLMNDPEAFMMDEMAAVLAESRGDDE